MLIEKQESEFELESVERTSPVIVEHKSDLNIDPEYDDEDMDSQLNPDAKEFVPVSPQRTTSVSSPFNNGIRSDLLDDDVVSQSPRKGSAVIMDDIVLPSENDFSEISQRPAELVTDEAQFEDRTNTLDVDNIINGDAQRPGSSSSQCSYQEMNLKEAMHGDEKQEFQAELQETETQFENIAAANNSEELNVFSKPLGEQDPMNMSFYNDGSDNNPFKVSEVDMNAVQPLPDDVIEEDVVPVNNNVQHEIFGFANDPVEQSNAPLSPQRLTDMVLVSNDENGTQDELIQTEAKNERIDFDAAHIDHLNSNEVFEHQSSITQVVQELATEVTSMLDEFKEHHDANPVEFALDDVQQPSEEHAVNYQENNQVIDDVISKSELSANANEFSPIKQAFGEVASIAEAANIFNVETNLSEQPIETEAIENRIDTHVESIPAPLNVEVLEQANEVIVAPVPEKIAPVVETVVPVSKALKSEAKSRVLDTKKTTATSSKSSSVTKTSPTKPIASKVSATAPKTARYVIYIVILKKHFVNHST